jgi:ABC-type transport system involved in cytochrome c biogenesis permease subunit
MQHKIPLGGRWAAAILIFIGMLAVFYNVIVDNLPKGEVRHVEGYVPWSEETLRIAETIPVQDGGRVMPFSTFASFKMLGLHGARSMKIKGDETDGKQETYKIKPTAWMLDALLRPHIAMHQPTFRVDNSDVLRAIGLPVRDKRDRYSYADLEPGRAALFEHATNYSKIAQKERNQLQQQVLALSQNMTQYERLLGYFSFARFGVTMKGSGSNGAPDRVVNMSAILATAPVIQEQLQAVRSQGGQLSPHIQDLLQQVLDAANFGISGLVCVPPTEKDEAKWLSAGNAIMSVMSGEAKDPETIIADVAAMESFARAAAEDGPDLRREMAAVRDRFISRAEKRGEFRHIKLENFYLKADWFLNAMVLFILGTLSAFATWSLGRGIAGRVFSWITCSITTVGLILCIVAIVQRCIIMERPPVGNLYDTIIFIAATTVLLSLIVEVMTRRRFALGLAPIIGMLLILLARRYEMGDAKDTMAPLVAVLDSNYWLTTHVITITLGYAGGLLAAALSCCYLLMRGLGLDGGDRSQRRALTGAVYGMICVTLFLSLVGTVLGGIWANDSWGRFWGWDPKENGALMIVIWTLVILHARLGGYIKEWGIHFCSVFTACVVAFSWWHVNFLGVGLHNYGFTAGKSAIWIFYGVMASFLAFGMVIWWLERMQPRLAPSRQLVEDSDLPEQSVEA